MKNNVNPCTIPLNQLVQTASQNTSYFLRNVDDTFYYKKALKNNYSISEMFSVF